MVTNSGVVTIPGPKDKEKLWLLEPREERRKGSGVLTGAMTLNLGI